MRRAAIGTILGPSILTSVHRTSRAQPPGRVPPISYANASHGPALRQSYVFFLATGKAGHVLALDKRLALGVLTWRSAPGAWVRHIDEMNRTIQADSDAMNAAIQATNAVNAAAQQQIQLQQDLANMPLQQN